MVAGSQGWVSQRERARYSHSATHDPAREVMQCHFQCILFELSQSQSSAQGQRRRNRFHLLVEACHGSGGTFGTGSTAVAIFRKYNLPHLASHIKTEREKMFFHLCVWRAHRQQNIQLISQVTLPTWFHGWDTSASESFATSINSALLQGHGIGPWQ